MASTSSAGREADRRSNEIATPEGNLRVVQLGGRKVYRGGPSPTVMEEPDSTVGPQSPEETIAQESKGLTEALPCVRDPGASRELDPEEVPAWKVFCLEHLEE